MDTQKRAFRDIAAGYSSGSTLGKSVYIKHLSYSDQIDGDDKWHEFFNEAKSQGLSTFDEKLTQLKRDGIWTDAKEKEIADCRRTLEGMYEAKKTQMKMPTLVKKYVDQIKEEEKRLTDKIAERGRLAGLTCEVYADQENSDYYILHNLFKDKELSEPFFGDHEFDYIEEAALKQVAEDYRNIMTPCSDQSVKKLSMQPFFQNYFALVGETLTNFFGKPICALTLNQVRLLNYGAHFRHIYTSNDVSLFPKDVMDDPDLLSDYASAAAKGKEDMRAKGAYEEDAVVLGAKKEDRKALGIKDSGNITSEIIKSGGNVMEYLMKRQG